MISSFKWIRFLQVIHKEENNSVWMDRIFWLCHLLALEEPLMILLPSEIT